MYNLNTEKFGWSVKKIKTKLLVLALTIAAKKVFAANVWRFIEIEAKFPGVFSLKVPKRLMIEV